MVESGSSKNTPYLWSVLYMTGYLTTDKDQSNLKEKYIRDPESPDGWTCVTPDIINRYIFYYTTFCISCQYSLKI